MTLSSFATRAPAGEPDVGSPRIRMRGLSAWMALALLVLVTVLAIKNIDLGSPIMAGDEYAYFVRAREFPTPDAALVYDPTVQATNNVLYFAIGHWLWTHTADPALSMRVLQSGEYGLLLLVLYATGRFFMGPLYSGAVALIAGVTAMSSYTAYFMPETLYQLLFACLCLVAVWLLPASTALGVAASAGVLALMLLTKPHAIAVVLAFVCVLLAIVAWPGIFRIPRRRSVPALILLLPLTWIALVVVNLLLQGRLQLNPMFVVGRFYETALTASGPPVPPLRNFLPPILGNTLALALLVGVPLVFIAHRLVVSRGRVPATPPEEMRAARFAVLALLGVAALAFAVSMTVSFTARMGLFLPSELLRMQGRYYSFSLPAIVIAAAAGNILMPIARRETWAKTLLRLAALLAIAVVTIAQFWWRTAYTLAPWDFPEIWALTPAGWFLDARTVGTLLLGFSAACFLLIALLPRLTVTVFLVFFAVFNLTSLVQATRWQFAHGRAFTPYTQPAAALRILLGPDLIDRGVIVGPDRGMLTYTLCRLRSRSRVILLPTGSTVDAAVAGSNAAWVLMQGDYKDDLTGRVIFQGTKLTLVALDGRNGTPQFSFTGAPHP